MLNNYELSYDKDGLAHAKFCMPLGHDKQEWWPFLGKHILPCLFGPNHSKALATEQAQAFKMKLTLSNAN